MLKHPVRKTIAGTIEAKPEVALAAAKHSASGLLSDMAVREFLKPLPRTG